MKWRLYGFVGLVRTLLGEADGFDRAMAEAKRKWNESERGWQNRIEVVSPTGAQQHLIFRAKGGEECSL